MWVRQPQAVVCRWRTLVLCRWCSGIAHSRLSFVLFFPHRGVSPFGSTKGDSAVFHDILDPTTMTISLLTCYPGERGTRWTSVRECWW